MAKIQHKDIPENQLHEPKGASLAAAQTFLVAKGDGTSEFRALVNSDLQGLVTASADVQLALDTHRNWGIYDLAVSSSFPNTSWSPVGFCLTSGSIPSLLSTEHITVVGNSSSDTTFIVETGGWYLIEGSFTLARVSGTAKAYAQVKFVVGDGSEIAPRIIGGGVNNNCELPMSLRFMQYFNPQDTFHFEARASNSNMVIGKEPSVSGFDVPIFDPTREDIEVPPPGGSGPNITLRSAVNQNGVKAWRIG